MFKRHLDLVLGDMVSWIKVVVTGWWLHCMILKVSSRPDDPVAMGYASLSLPVKTRHTSVLPRGLCGKRAHASEGRLRPTGGYVTVALTEGLRSTNQIPIWLYQHLVAVLRLV